jgi:hypothetical protein
MMPAKLRRLRFFGSAARAWRLAALSAAIFLAVTIGIATQASAASANGGVYIIAPKWWGWCPNVAGRNNYPYYMSQENYTTGDSS